MFYKFIYTSKFLLFSFLLVIILGVLQRAYFIGINVYLPYKNLLHSHSHFAFSGWISQSLFYLINQMLWKDDLWPKKIRFAYLFHFLCSYGMLFSFLYQSYGPISITFSTLSIFSGYIYALFLFLEIKNDKSISFIFLRFALIFLIVSSIGTYYLAYLMAIKNTDLILKQNTISFYLHFQYNGWFFFAFLSIIFHYFKESFLQFNKKWIYLLFLTTTISYCFLIDNQQQPIFNVFLLLVAFINILLFLKIMKILYLNVKSSTEINNIFKNGLMTIFFFIVIKSFFQFISILPYFSSIIKLNHALLINYLHFVFLLIYSFFILVFLYVTKHIFLPQYRNKLFVIFIILLVLNQLGLLLKSFDLTKNWTIFLNQFLFVLSIFLMLNFVTLISLNKKTAAF
ncbi:MAG: hypothetical protein HYU67_02020 [Flavobacteriia bacterium]|nr:hypothetical protein [Flavobacteriia bacterium]